jgi:hypothetical protein
VWTMATDGSVRAAFTLDRSIEARCQLGHKADLRLGGRVPSPGAGGPVLHAAVAVRRGRISLGRLSAVLGSARPMQVTGPRLSVHPL